ncbi:TMEM165/GDT1 family protein [Govanella unica]|uniref:GDT1 family protein n=1 Tax=Govanella unica TaxID=2975056 RepID=A0A9X3TZB0_9PROT|nr:TMEM165/GDT1 family protein [Govania unica]MDA5194229.1 TMEM165/GDT1 family protein [Govania unica]
MESFLVSTGVVAIAEIGDKTQLLALLLAARFRKPVAIIAGIFIATVANHTLAAWVGTLAAELLSADVMRWVLGLSFIAMSAWALVPDKVDDEPRQYGHFGAFLATVVAFFLLEMGDKTQIATVALAARFDNVLWVAMGTTLGMMIANVPAVLLGDAVTKRVSLKLVRIIAALIFAVIGVLTLLNVGAFF